MTLLRDDQTQAEQGQTTDTPGVDDSKAEQTPPSLMTSVTAPPTQPVFVARSHQLFAIMNQMERMALVPSMAVLLRGETGSGKEAVARELHAMTQASRSYWKGPFVTLNLSVLSTEIVESEMFGHVKGSFTGTTQNRAGMIESALLGTLFLDEIADLNLDLQGKLMNFLDDHQIRRVGQNNTARVETRVVAATNKDLEAAVKKGTFRFDLYQRLRVIQLYVPPLREHKDDILEMTSVFLRKINYDHRLNLRYPISNEVLKFLQLYNWPGNVRELYNALLRAATFCDGGVLQVKDFDLANLQVVTAELPSLTASTQSDTFEGLSPKSVKKIRLAAIEIPQILRALIRAHWNRKHSLKEIGVSYKTLLNKVNEYDLRPGDTEDIAITRYRLKVASRHQFSP